MMKAKDIINLVRYQLKDNNAVQYSDYDVMQALNACLRYINQYYINSDFLEQVVYYREDEINAQIDEANQTADTPVAHVSMKLTGVELPEDFLSLVRVVRECDGVDMHPCQAIKTPWPREYKILQNKIYAGSCITSNLKLYPVSTTRLICPVFSVMPWQSSPARFWRTIQIRIPCSRRLKMCCGQSYRCAGTAICARKCRFIADDMGVKS